MSFQKAARGAPGIRGLIRVPCVSAPGQWRAFGVDLSHPWRRFESPDCGWIIMFMRVPKGPAEAVVSPSMLPMHNTDYEDKALCACVLLPEAGGFHQYWVSVSEQHRWAQLQTSEWTVSFFRRPQE